MNTKEALEKTLALQMETIEDLRDQLSTWEAKNKREQYERDWAWRQIQKLDDDEFPDLPIPRLEIRWHRTNDGYSIMATYGLVYRHLLDEVYLVPLGCTKRSGYLNSRKEPCLDLPFRDGCHMKHDAKNLHLPAFVVDADFGESRRAADV